MEFDIAKLIDDMKPTSTNRNEGDYEEDGLLYCGKCHTPKQTVIRPFGEDKVVDCICLCEREARDKAEAERLQQEEFNRVRRLKAQGFPDSEMANWTFDNDDGSNARISKIARRYVEKWPEMVRNSKGLLLFGPVGTGKTFHATCIANALIDKKIPCMVTNFSRIVNSMQSFEGRQEYLDELNRYSLLVIDDLGAERRSEYMAEMVHSVIDSRYRSGKPIIVTTNLSKADMTNADDITNQRIYSRLFEMCFPIEVKGVDRREKKLKRDFSEMAKILGLDE